MGKGKDVAKSMIGKRELEGADDGGSINARTEKQ
jgi:hypothetical protein